jgi:hypothetical protein
MTNRRKFINYSNKLLKEHIHIVLDDIFSMIENNYKRKQNGYKKII